MYPSYMSITHPTKSLSNLNYRSHQEVGNRKAKGSRREPYNSGKYVNKIILISEYSIKQFKIKYSLRNFEKAALLSENC